MALLIAAPFFILTYLWNRFGRLQEKEIHQKYGEFYKDLNLEQGRMVLLQPTWFMLRRLMLAVTVVFFNSTVIWQIAVIVTQIILQVNLLGWVKPFTDPQQYHMEMLNEVVIMFVLYSMLCFTPFVEDVSMKFKVGYVVCSIVLLYFVFNAVIIVQGTFRDLRVQYRIYREK